MNSYSNLLLEMYRSARSFSTGEFPDVAMQLVRSAFDFDSGRLLSANMATGAAVVQDCVMYNIPDYNALDWESIQRKDLAAHRVLACPGTPVSFNSPTLFSGPDNSVVRDYANRYDHQNGLVMVLHDSETGFTDGYSFYRRDPDAHFSRYDQLMLKAVMPHLQDAIKLNRQLDVPTADTSARGALLIAHIGGMVQHCGAQARQLMESEWSPWQQGCLPSSLLEALRSPGSAGYAGRHITIRYSRVNELLFLRIAPRSPLARLTARELEVASLYSRGVPIKLLATQLFIAPSTARNTLQKIYQKLGLHDKAALANLLSQ
ncbi:hypothetical protein GTP46_08690 [Duganella sp. FT135W]|uniref:HTH luxR-type domain-containing protein n=1 Tax=Duganella flavida TaxID=2692175 RepID=A0A6L8KE42_9BURK|nr:helix-turn-helix transcriptional regulator [Duganella flavida]MYM22721.1 hypothetical protein [Duganella flavida]